jgi:putative hemolysin
MPPRDETERGDYHTLAGMLLAHSGRIPKTGDTVVIGDFIFNIVDMDGRRIDKVLIYNKENPHAQEFIKNQTRTLKN